LRQPANTAQVSHCAFLMCINQRVAMAL